ncbi:MAG: SGNH/GDSL hydrolase family protein [Oligoflexia bacterium]|nr:SGNH/GDSL hydrolase family protein [Oligoflexia bacterium]
MVPSLRFHFAFLSIAFLLSSPGLASSPKRLLMGVIGDSVSAASLADVPIPNAASSEERVRQWAKNGLSPDFIFENKQFSWASGTMIESHYEKLRRWLNDSGEKRPLDVYNAAFPGNTTKALANQANQVVQMMELGDYAALKYVTVLIGSNDVCDNGPVVGREGQLLANLLQMFQQLASIKQSEPIRILLVGIPRIPDLGAPQFRQASTLFGLSCEFVRNEILGFCNSLLSWSTPIEYEADMQIVDDMNSILKESVEVANREFPNLNVVYTDRLYNTEIPLGDLAADCFHPNKVGQAGIADELWSQQPWFGPSP